MKSIGTVSFSEKALVKLLSLNAEIVGVATKSKSDFNSDHMDLSPICEEQGIPMKYVKDINSPQIIEWIKSFDPDIVFCSGWSNLVLATEDGEVLVKTYGGAVRIKGHEFTELPKKGEYL